MEKSVTRRPKKTGGVTLLAAVLAVALIGLLIWCVLLVWNQEEEPPASTQNSRQTTQTTSTVKPLPEPEPDPDPRDPAIIEAERKLLTFASEHGLTMEDYHPKMVEILAQKPELEEFLLNIPLEYGKEHPIDISGYADCEGVPLFIQWDKQWGVSGLHRQHCRTGRLWPHLYGHDYVPLHP